MKVLDLAIRHDGIGFCGCPSTKWTTWSVRIDGREASCMILYREDYIYIEDLRTNIPGYGSLLFQDILDYLDQNHPGTPIILYDTSGLWSEGQKAKLWIISFLKYGELSFYSKFGFVACHADINYFDTEAEFYKLRYEDYSVFIKSITSKQALNYFQKSSNKYQWIQPLIEVLSGKDDKLMIDEIRESDLNLKKLNIDEDEFDIFIKNNWNIIRYEVFWIRKI